MSSRLIDSVALQCKAGALKAQGESSDAWDSSPDKALRLKMKDIKQSLKERWLQLFWPEDGRWWPGQVTEVHAKERKISLLYKTGAHRHLLYIIHLILDGVICSSLAQAVLSASMRT